MIKCLWCKGNFYYASSLPHTGAPGLICMHCARSDDLRYELMALVEQMKEHTGNHTYGSSADYRYRKRHEQIVKSKIGRKNKWA